MKNQDQFLGVLTDLGLKSQEAKVYLACLKLGQSTVGKIADEAGVQRTFVYDILKDLHAKGIVSSILLRGKMHFSAISVEKFKLVQQEKFRRFEVLIPEIKALEVSVGDRPRVQFYEGIDGVFAALNDTLNLPVGSELLAYATGTGLYEQEKERSDEYLKQRIKRKIFARSIAPDTLGTRVFTNKNKEQLRETRLVPADKFNFTNEIDIYGNKVAIMSVQGEFLAVIIESESVARTQRMIFELAWLGAGKFNES